jgi:hypothetical protein
MPENETVWPMGMKDRNLSDRPMIFNPRGFLVAILTDADEADRAVDALGSAGFADRKLRVYTSQEILADHDLYTAQRSVRRRVVGALTDDQQTVAMYVGHARDGRSALWIQVDDDAEANRAIRGLADFDTLHIRHYGHEARPTSTSAAPCRDPVQ